MKDQDLPGADQVLAYIKGGEKDIPQGLTATGVGLLKFEAAKLDGIESPSPTPGQPGGQQPEQHTP
jgi:hypothetical protein